MEPQDQQQKSSDHLYLDKLEFKPEVRKTWLNFFVSNFRVVILLIIILSSWGIYSYTQLPLESNPEVKIPFAIVVTTLPGAAPADVEELVTKKIETQISGIKGIKKISSSSSNSFSVVSVEFDTRENQDDAIRRLRDKITSIKDLPGDATEPSVNEISFDDRPIYTFSFIGPYDGFTMREFAEKLQDELEKIPGVREANVSGGDEREFEIAYDPQRLTFYSLSPDAANQAVVAANRAIPGGNFEGRDFNYSVRTDGRFFDAEKLGNIPVMHTDQGAIIYLKDIAAVSERAIKKTIYSRFSTKGSDPQNAITIDVVKQTGASITQVVSDSKKTIDDFIPTLPPGISYDTTTDFAKIIEKDFTQLTHDFLITLVLVIAVLFFIVGLKEAVVAGMAIPLVFFATFAVMNATGTTLNFLSIFSLILSLGLLVDDAIVVVSATKQYMKTGKFTPEEAVLLVLKDFKVLLTTTTLTTIWAFLPLLLASGIIGEFIKSIPITVSVTLFASLIIALVINHPLAATLERIRLTRKLFWIDVSVILAIGAAIFYFQKNIFGYAALIVALLVTGLMIRWYRQRGKKLLIENRKLMIREADDDDLIKKKLKEQGEAGDTDFFSRLIHGIVPFAKLIPTYEKYLKLVICTRKRRVITLLSTLALFIAAILIPVLGIVPTEFFPNSDFENIYISIEAPAGLKLDETNAIVENVEATLLNYPEIVNFSTVVGKEGASPSDAGSGGLKNSSHLASIVVTISDKKERTIASYDLAEEIRQSLSSIKEATIRVEAPRGGPPGGAAFEAQIIGEDLQVLDRISHDLQPLLASIPGVVDINSSLKDAPAEYTFRLDPSKMELYNVNATSVGSMIRLAISGTEITKVIRENKEIKVMARFASDKIPTLESIQNLQLMNFLRQPVYVRDVAEVELKPSVDTITRIDQKRVVRLSAGVTGETRPNAVLVEFQKKLKESYQLPKDYSIVYGGENEQNTESVVSILKAMVIAVILIVSTLIIQFNSFKKAMIVLVTLPLALIGVFVGMAILRINLSFPGLIGILALFGIVVKNAIILVDKVNLNLKSGIAYYDSVIDAGKSRLEAIFITSICTIFGILPVTLSNEVWMALGAAVIFGLMLSSFFTLFIVPVLFVTFIGEEERF